MDVKGFDGEGIAQMFRDCDGGLDQYFFLDGDSRLRNAQNEWCLDIEGSNVVMTSCSPTQLS